MFQKISAKALLFFLFITLYSSIFSNETKTKSSLIPTLNKQIRECLNPEISLSTHVEIEEILDAIEEKSVFLERGSDDLRLKFATLQGAVEQVLSLNLKKGKLQRLIGVIHAPAPTTPLCTRREKIDETLLNPTIRSDPKKVATVRCRSKVLRDYLDSGAKLFITYPQNGLNKRSRSQQQVYLEELKKHPNELFDCPLTINEIDPEQIGAFYLFEDKDENQYVFSIKARQANDPVDYSEWGIWFGPKDSPVVQERIKMIHHYIHISGGPNLNREYTLCNQM